MIARRLVRWGLAPACLLAALLPAPAQTKDDAHVLKLRLYGSIIPGRDKKDARDFTQPLCELLSEQVRQRIECDVHEGTTPEDLFKFGEKLSGGGYHLGAVWGIEYGWLRQKFPNLKVLVVASSGQKNTQNCTILFARKGGDFKQLADLKGKRLADYKDVPLMDRVFLRQMFREEKLDLKDFLVKNKPVNTVKAAASAVVNGRADCVAMNRVTFARLSEVYEGLADALVEIKAGEIYPPAALVGSPEAVERLRKGLWSDLQEHLLQAHNSSRGKDCINFWRIQYFEAPDDDYLRKADGLAHDLPVSVLTRE